MAQSANKRVKKIRPSTNVTDIAYSNCNFDLSNDSISPSVSIRLKSVKLRPFSKRELAEDLVECPIIGEMKKSFERYTVMSCKLFLGTATLDDHKGPEANTAKINDTTDLSLKVIPVIIVRIP